MSLTLKQAEKLAGWINEMKRLDALTVPELIHEVAGTDALKHPAVAAVLRRLDPHWMDRYGDDGEPLPDSGLARFPAEVSP